jgi:hypothetical protein
MVGLVSKGGFVGLFSSGGLEEGGWIIKTKINIRIK